MESGRFRKKKVNFSMVSNTIIRDENVSLKAKGLYTLIQSYITMENFTLYKDFLVTKCKEGSSSFDCAWKELKKLGYLKQYKINSREGFYYEYELLDSPDADSPGMGNPCVGNPCVGYPVMGYPDVENMGDINNTIKNNILNSNTDPIISSADVMDMIGYDAFPVEDKTWLDEIVMLITEVFGMRDDKPVRISRDYISAASVKERYDKLNMGHIRYVLDSLRQNAGEIGNVKNYLLTTLYNAPTTMNTYYQNQIHNGY